MKIFYDQTGLRWRKAKFLLKLILGFWIFLTLFFLLSITIRPSMNDLSITQQKLTPKTPDKVAEYATIAVASKDYQTLLKDSKNFLGPRLPNAISINATNQNGTQTMAFYVGDENGLNSLKANLDKIDVLFPLWLELDRQQLSLKINDTDNIKQVTDITKTKIPNMQIMPVISNYSSTDKVWDYSSIDKLLNSSIEIQNNLIDKLLKFAIDYKMNGMVLDFEGVSLADQNKYIQFTSNVKTKFEQNNLLLSVNLPFDNKDYDFQKFAEISNFIIISAYDEHWLSSGPGPIASQKWFQDNLLAISSKIPKEKLVLALGAYGYDWADGEKTAQTIGYSQAVQLAKTAGTDIIFNNANLNSNFEYFDNSKLHQVYLLDAVSAFNETQFAVNFQPKGYAIWRLGFEDNSVWDVLKGFSLNDKLNGIEKISALNTVDYQGSGDVLRTTAIPSNGERKIYFDKDLNLITNADYTKLPSGNVIARNGKGQNNTVTLTFDDGPDPAITPKILDILKKYNAKATFFVVGNNAEKNVGIVKRIAEDGHLIGNHTFTHADISQISENQLNLELNTTQLLIESILNIKTLLFRPPYSEDSDPQTLAQAMPLNQASKAGYYAIGISIDPKDWKMPGIEQIVKSTVEQAVANGGGIVILHDGGGDRSQTIEALPKIIETLRGKGFKIVPLNEMIGVDANLINPPAKEDFFSALFNLAYLRFLTLSLYFLQALFLFGVIIGILRFIPIIIMSIVHAYKTRRKKYDVNYHPKVSVVVAAYNEEKVIKETVENILESDYDKDKFEVIIVNDGSKDKTWQVLKKNFANNPNVILLYKKNAGKSAAVNYGIKKSSGEIFVSLDADTLIDPRAIKLLVRHFCDPKIGAVAGNAKVGNRGNLLTKFQAIEYITCQNLDKRAFDLLNAITVVPGAIGAWRIDLIKELGGLDKNTLAEDSDLTLHIIQKGYVVHFEEGGIAYTEAPMTIKALAAQRFRWSFGTLQVVVKNKELIANPKYKWLGIIGLPNVLYFQFFSPLITPIVDFALFLQIIIGLTQLNSNLNIFSLQQFTGLFFFYIIFIIMDFFSCILAFLLDGKEDWKLLWWLIPQRIFYRFFINWMCLKSLVTAVKGNQIGWNKLERKGNVHKEVMTQAVYDT